MRFKKILNESEIDRTGIAVIDLLLSDFMKSGRRIGSKKGLTSDEKRILNKFLDDYLEPLIKQVKDEMRSGKLK